MAAPYGMNRYEFDPEQDLKAYSVWLCDRAHPVPEPARPLSICLWIDGISYGMQHGCEVNFMPETKGWDKRLIDGHLYLAVIECEPEEIPEREKRFREKIKPIIEDFDGEWKKEIERWMAVVDEFKQFDVSKASNIELLDHLDDYLVRLHRGWFRIHFDWMYPLFGLYNLFIELCEELTGIDPEHPTFKKLISGFDNMLFLVNRDLWRLGDRARQLGLAEMFLGTENNAELLSELERSDAGRKWLQEYYEWLKVEGWRCRDIWDISSPMWLEQPSLPLRDIKLGLAKGGAFTLDAERERLGKEREEVEKELLAKVPIEQKGWFEKLMRIAQKSGVFSEEHNYYLDIPGTALARRIFIEYGKRLAQAGVIDDPEDIFFLLPDEIRKAAIPMGRVNLRPYVKMHREEWQSYFKIEPKPFYGDISQLPQIARKNAIVRVIVAPPRVRPELKADLYGGASSPGVVEGTARVIMTEGELNQLQPGEILVAPMTAASWTPAFGIIIGVVTDAGGTLNHAAIVAREHRIPAVVGTMEATKKIKSGDRIRLDGDMNAVYILK